MATDKASLINLITTKIDILQKDSNQETIDSLEKLFHDITITSESVITQEYCNKLLIIYPELDSSSTSKPKKPIRTKCEECGSALSDNKCTKCGLVIKPGIRVESKNKTKESISVKVTLLEDRLKMLTAETPLDQTTMQKVEIVKAAMLKLGYAINPKAIISANQMREAYRSTGDKYLTTHYDTVPQMRYHITGYRPKPFTDTEKAFIINEYKWLLEAYFEIQSKESTTKSRTNSWNWISWVRMIIQRDSNLSKNHLDLLEYTMDYQTSSTLKKHCLLMNKMLANRSP